MEKKQLCQLVMNSLLFLLVITHSYMGLLTFLPTITPLINLQNIPNSKQTLVSTHAQTNQTSSSRIPRLAYSISGTKGDLESLWRTLRAIYHPRNVYVVHLDLESPNSEREELASRIKNDKIFAKMGNVHVIVKANMVTYRGPTMISNTLHACAVLLKKSKDWDWFINLSSSDYPLVTQDDILHIFSSLPRNLNFVDHTSRLGWKEMHRARPLIIDPGLYLSEKSNVYWVTQSRELPTAFKLFTGSAWMVLSREFVYYCVLGYDNLPRTLLMYYTNFISSSEGYFQTVICNAPKFTQTIVNHDLHFIQWDWPPKQHPRTLTLADKSKMIGSNVPFARKFRHNDPVLDRIDVELLGWRNESFVPGGWCEGSPNCSEVGDSTRLKPGKGAGRLARLMYRIVKSRKSRGNQCT
ncbi:uncharacterized protein A4U43_C05F30220 [Asparagus officinalis]|uniref:Uncharacterized protein n=1 Tax=Asparagus officinalis TaxID=4686 RepID=A0A5P1EVN8_ASPOF|nr:beta-glucuronosyltransferase GlcAT14A-like [Asparagus officinalis]ONK70096.1 uncharacterized protein A4U43_C05F30220 [Asparagus officinalis]